MRQPCWIYIDFSHGGADNQNMNREDIEDLAASIITLIEHNAIITGFDDIGELDRDDALDKCANFINEFPDFLGSAEDIDESPESQVEQGEADDQTIVNIITIQRDWLTERTIAKYNERTISNFFRQLRKQLTHNNYLRARGKNPYTKKKKSSI